MCKRSKKMKMKGQMATLTDASNQVSNHLKTNKTRRELQVSKLLLTMASILTTYLSQRQSLTSCQMMKLMPSS
jgi:hypothetical protein